MWSKWFYHVFHVLYHVSYTVYISLPGIIIMDSGCFWFVCHGTDSWIPPPAEDGPEPRQWVLRSSVQGARSSIKRGDFLKEMMRYSYGESQFSDSIYIYINTYIHTVYIYICTHIYIIICILYIHHFWTIELIIHSDGCSLTHWHGLDHNATEIECGLAKPGTRWFFFCLCLDGFCTFRFCSETLLDVICPK